MCIRCTYFGMRITGTQFLAEGILAFLVRMLVAASLGLSDIIARGQLIRPNHVYQGVISGIHDHFNNTCIILLHATVDPMSFEGTNNAALLRDLQMYFSHARHTRTAIMDLDTFATKVGSNFYRIKRPLFVILNDQDNTRRLLTSVSTWITMAYPTWLIFFSEGTRTGKFFARMNIPFDCEFMVSQSNGTTEIITEVYRVSSGDVLRTTLFGTWSPADGVRTTRLTFYQRRGELFGKNLYVTSIENPPMSTILKGARGEMIGVGGMFGKILEILKGEMNCTFNYVEETAWGSLFSNGSWNGMIALLNEKKADLAASELVITTARIEVVDFTTPIVSSRFHTYIQRPSFALVKWRVYTAPFAASIWTAVSSLIILASFVIYSTRYAGHRDDRKDSDQPTLLGTTFFIFGAFCGQGLLPARSLATRIAHLAVHLTSVVLIAAYSGALVSFLAVQIFTMPFTTMEGLLKDGGYRFGVVPYSAEYNMFSNTSDRILRALYEDMMELDHELPINYLEGLRRVCGKPGYAFMITNTMVGALANRVDCIPEALETMLQTSLAMAVPKDSPYRGIINANILMMRDGGILDRILRTEWPNKLTKTKEAWTSVAFGDVVPLMIVLVCGIILGIVFVLAERFVMYQDLRSRPLRKVCSAGTTHI